MRFKIKEIDEAGLPVDVALSAAWLSTEVPDLGATPGPEGLVLRGRLEPAGDDYLLRAQLKGAIETSCSRCLEPARLPVDIPVTVTYVERADDDGDDDDEDDHLGTFAGGVIDLGPDVRDELLLALPMSPVCREDCAGLCPVCGGNRNHKPCDCEQRQGRVAAPLATLAQIKPH